MASFPTPPPLLNSNVAENQEKFEILIASETAYLINILRERHRLKNLVECSF